MNLQRRDSWSASAVGGNLTPETRTRQSDAHDWKRRIFKGLWQSLAKGPHLGCKVCTGALPRGGRKDPPDGAGGVLRVRRGGSFLISRNWGGK